MHDDARGTSIVGYAGRVRRPKAAGAAARPTDRRVLRTRATLREALVRLILERGWDDISVQDVCDRANVGRSTFYSHFADKEELLLAGFDDLRKALVALRVPGA